MPLDCRNLIFYWKAIILQTWFAIILKLLLLMVRLCYSYLVFDDVYAKSAYNFLIHLTPDAVGLSESYLLLEGHYLKKWFFYCFNINYSPLDYYIPTLYLMMAIPSRLFSSRYPLTQNAVGLSESSPLLEGNYFNNWFLYYFNINYSPIDNYIPTLYLMITMQSWLFVS
jgi:hypothetical protein